jgi:hypothetical protein
MMIASGCGNGTEIAEAIMWQACDRAGGHT